MKKKGLFTCLGMILASVLILHSVVPASAYQNNTADDIRERFTTTVFIRDIGTGDVVSYELDTSDAKVYYNAATSETTVTMTDIGSNIGTYDASQSNGNTFYGWKGNVRITWYQDADWARLTSAGGDWTRVSGNYSMTEKSLTYGQFLGTNTRSNTVNFTNSYNVAPGWPLGKYGDKHYVGANISGRVNNQYVDIVCNYSLF